MGALGLGQRSYVLRRFSEDARAQLHLRAVHELCEADAHAAKALMPAGHVVHSVRDARPDAPPKLAGAPAP